jgi:hypothetical protein
MAAIIEAEVVSQKMKGKAEGGEEEIGFREEE